MEAATYHPAWNALGTFLWIVVVLAVVFVFRSDLRELLRILVTRLKIGASFKVAGIEIGAAYVEPGSSVIRAGAVSAVREDKNGRRWDQRRQYYEPNRNLQLVHRLAPSTKPEQLYDVLIYLVPHHDSDATLASVKKVEYYFGKS